MLILVRGTFSNKEIKQTNKKQKSSFVNKIMYLFSESQMLLLSLYLLWNGKKEKKKNGLIFQI